MVSSGIQRFVITVLFLCGSCLASRESIVEPGGNRNLLAACPNLPAYTPKNINDLHPNNIKVVMALGDSITAAFGLRGMSGGFNEFRGQSWSIGGDSGAITVANYLKQFNPDIQGAAQGSHLVEVCYGIFCPPFQYHETIDKLDAAQSGAMIDDLQPHELDYLVSQLKKNKAIDFDNDWKVLTILIGANDICASCEFLDKGFRTPDEFSKYLLATLERVRTSIPRVFVNIIDIFNLSQVYTLSLQKPYCKDLHRDLFIECDCAFSPLANKTRTEMDIYSQAYNQKARELARYYQSQNLTDFAVVMQTFGQNAAIDKLDIDFLSTLDCFHPSQIAHEIMATALWNSMLTPAAKKKTVIDISDTPICPAADTLLYTW